jgi:magnesium-protoporphyrin IX monomethyl ester (oxidative) cyclase
MNLTLLTTPVTIPRKTPKTCLLPLGLAYLAAAVKDRISVKIIDCLAEGYEQEISEPESKFTYGLSYNEIQKLVKQNLTDIAGISCNFTPQHHNLVKTATACRNAGVKTIIAGGEHSSLFAREILNECSDIDIIVVGEGEKTFAQLIHALISGSDWSNIPGIVYKNGEGKIIINTAVDYIKDLDTIIFPARDLLDLENYFSIHTTYFSSKSRYATPVITSRGCPYRCSYCGTTKHWGHKYRRRSPANVVAEIEELVNRYNIKEIQFLDDNLTADKNRAIAIFRLLSEKIPHLSWSTPNGVTVSTLTDELLDAAASSGCYELLLAIESGNQHIQDKYIDKKIDLAKNSDIVKSIRKRKIRAGGLFMVGFPGETAYDIKNTFRYAYMLGLDYAYFSITTPIPGTALYQECSTNDFLVKRFSYDNFEFYSSNINTELLPVDTLHRIYKREKYIYHLRNIIRRPWIIRDYIRNIKNILRMMFNS